MMDANGFEQRCGREERSGIDTITLAVWAAIGVVLILAPLVMVSLG